MAAAQERSHSDELASGKILGEIALIHGIKFIVQGEIGAGDLHVDEIVHAETSLSKKSFVRVENIFDLIIDFFRSLLGFWVQGDITRDIKGIANENGVAVGGLGQAIREVNRPSLRHDSRLRKSAVDSKESCDRQ